MRFTKGQEIEFEGKIYRCILCDIEYACFGELKRIGENSVSLSMEETFIVSNIDGLDDGFKCKLIQK